MECCRDFDGVLTKINGLTWLPWIGCNYPHAQKKILVLGESHYRYGNYTQEDIEKCPTETREIVDEYVEKGLNAGDQSNTYEPMEKVLLSSALKNRNHIQAWLEIAYMNLIQKCMIDKKTRPNWELYLEGWKCVIPVIHAIKPDLCICFSSDESKNRVNFNRLEEFRNSMGFSYSIVKNGNTSEKIAGCRVATPGIVVFEQLQVPVIFVQHAGRMKAETTQLKWSEVIIKHIENLNC